MASLQRSFERRQHFKKHGGVKKYHKWRYANNVPPKPESKTLFSRIKARLNARSKSDFGKNHAKRRV